MIKLSNLVRMGIAHECFGNPIPRQAYDLIDAVEKAISDLKHPVSADKAQHPEWNGEGLPPVGVKVEWLSEQYGWLGGTVAAHDAKYPLIAIIRHNDGYTGCHRHEIRTESDRKREEVIDCIANLIHRSDPGDDATSVYEAIADGKIPGVELSK